LLRVWENVLIDLERDVSSTRDRIDWVAKKFLLSALREEERLAWSDPWLQAIDLEYHNIAPDQGLFYELLRQGSIRRVVNEEEVKAAIFSPPETTRAYFRGRSVTKRINLPEATNDARLDRLNQAARECTTASEFLGSIL
jgi:proteasome accessory factor A